ncbi:geranylgeranyl reductase family protein [Methanobacterium paludis]|uniref:Geranylgeranyl reductase n=1 Tax=Methanobacterium paludis (strain DSM 25820 / JCM 18151 / SWAN1) TaxID=868131 RepID=F6D2H7_METPW|nr:geranylgeranyl reductase family protein [Methanobacterium paludis]AEG17334.1 geranylgeranyl reductase [Methanobacterium paludis]
MSNYDIVVVGAGPVGSTFARYMAEEGFKVGIMERKKDVGVPLQCAGLVGKKIKKLNIVPDEFILNKVYGAYLHSPSGTVLSVSKKEPEAYVLDRVAYDKFLAELAVDKGAELLLNHRVDHVDIKTGDVYLKNHENKKISADVIVGADGYASSVSDEFNHPSKTFQAAQYLVDTGIDAFDSDYVHLYVDSKISPGFLWIIPVSESQVRIGIFAESSYQDLTKILNEFLDNEKFKNASILKKYQGFIPVYDPKKEISKDRSILLGDAASQVKPTTGGGLIMGFRSAKIAAGAVSNALHSQDIQLLEKYGKECMKKYKGELRMQLEVQKIFQSMTNEDLDKMFLKLKEGGAEAMISEYGDMDTQSPLIKEMLKSGLLFSILPGMLSRRISNLWK